MCARVGASLGGGRLDQSGSVAFELVLLVPVLVLLTVFVLWAGRGGRAALTADLAAEEAVTAAALCCEEDTGGASAREALVEDVLDARPGLGFLCVGGPRPDRGGSGGFLSERWLEFEPGRDSGGVGVLGVQLVCESDGAVAPLRGWFPTVTFHGQAAEVVQREPRFIVGFFPTRVEVEEGGVGTGLVFTVVLEPAFGEEVTLSYEVDWEATTVEPEDFDAAFLGEPGWGTVVIPAGAGSAEIVLPAVVDDGFFEGEEQLVLMLTGVLPPTVVLDDDRRVWTGVVEDNDPQPYLQIMGAPRVAEGGTLEFRVRVGVEGGAVVGDIAEEFTVHASTVGSPVDDCCVWATPGQDYTPVSTPVDSLLTFIPGGALEVLVQVVTLDDVDSPEGEDTEYVRLVLSDRSTGAPPLHGVRWKADGEIVDDEATVSVSDVTAADAAEGDPVVFRVTLDKAPAADVTLDYTLGPDARVGAHQAVGGSCPDGDDYLGTTGQVTGQVTVAALSEQQTFVVQTCEDVLVERDETFWVGLSRAANGGEVVVEAGTGAHGTIRNDDIPVISVSPATAEGLEGEAGRLAFTVSLTVGGDPAQLSEDITVDYEIAGSGSDPATAPGEPDADYGVTLDTATLSGPTLQGTLAFTAGIPPVSKHVFEVELLADHFLEGPETFELSLSDGDPNDTATLAPVTATGTILDDPPPVLSVDGFTGPEGTTQSFTVTLDDARSGETVTVDYVITGDEVAGNGDTATAPGHRTKPADFDAMPSVSDVPAGSLNGTLTFVPGTTAQTVDVSLLHDTLIEAGETLRLTLTNPSGAVLSGSDPNNVISQIHATGTITDVPPPVLSVDGFTGPEGTTQTFTITLDGARSGKDATVDYVITGDEVAGNGDTATAPGHLTRPADFDAVPSVSDVPAGSLNGTLTFVPGTIAQTVDVSLLHDTLIEADETLRLTLTNPSGAVLSGSDRDNIISEIHAAGTIEHVDPPVLSVDDFTGPEGTTQTFTITLADPRPGQVTVDYAFAPGSPNPAVPGDDYTAVAPADLAGGTLTFPGGVTQRTIDVSLLLDNDTGGTEGDETLELRLSGAMGASVGDDTGVGTITNVTPPWITVDNAAADEGSNVEFAVTVCNRRPGETVTVDFDTTNRNAAAGLDYEPVSGTLTFDDSSPAPATDPAQVSQRCGAGGVTAQSRSVTVATLPDAIAEVEERFHLLLSEHDDPLDPRPLNAVLDKGFGVGTINDVSVASVVVTDAGPVEEGQDLRFTISVVDSTTGAEPTIVVPVSVWYETADRTAEAGADYEPLARTQITFNAGSDTHIVTVPTLTDTNDEDDETLALLLSNVTPHAAIGDTEGTGTIEDADPPALRIEDATAEEGDPLTFMVRLGTRDENGLFVETPTSRPVTVTATTADVTAVAPGDYSAKTQLLEFMPGTTAGPGFTSLEFTVASLEDDLHEQTETFTVRLGLPENSRLDRSFATGTILPKCIEPVDGQDPPVLYPVDGSFIEGTLVFRIAGSTSEPVCRTVSVDVTSIEGTARYYTDYLTPPVDPPISSPITPFQTYHGTGLTHGWQQEDNYVLDGLDEDDETFTVRVRWGQGTPDLWQAEPWATATHTIIDADPEPALRISDAFAREGDSMTFEVELDAPSGRTVSVEYRTVDGTATAGQDYDEVLWTLIQFVPDVISGETPTTQTFTVDTFADTDHVDDTFMVELRRPDPNDPGSPPLNALIADGVATGRILEGGRPTLRIHDARADEAGAGNAGGTLVFLVELSAPAVAPVTVHYETVQMPQPVGAATEGDDYSPVDGDLTFNVGEQFMTVDVQSLHDDEPEADETFLVELSNPSSGVSLADPSAVGTINGDVSCYHWYYRPDLGPPPQRIADASAIEGSGIMTFTVTLEWPYCLWRQFAVNSSDWGANRATRFVDYSGGGGVVALPALATEVSFFFELFDDDIDEGDETFRVGLGNPGTDPNPAVGTIIDDDNAQLSVDSPASGPEGGLVNLRIVLDRPVDRQVTVDYTTEDSAPLSAAAGADYRARSGTAVIPAGERSATVAVFAPQDALYEFDETFLFRLSDPTGGAGLAPGGEVGVARIVDDDDPPAVRVSNPIADEGDMLVFEVTLDVPAGRDASVSYVTRDGPASGGAEADADYEVTSGQLDFAAGETAKTVSVQALDDGETEDDEIFFLDLSGPDLRYDKPTGTGTIRDRSVRRVSVSDAVAGEGGVLEFVVGIEGPPAGRDITVQYSTVAGTAEAGIDYDDAVESAPGTVPGTVRILAGTSSAVALVQTALDTLDEDLEQLTLVLSAPSAGAELAAGEAVGTILDDDAPPLLSIDDPEATENGDDTPITFTVSLSEVSGRDVSVHYRTVDSSARAVEDYVAVVSPVGSPLVIGRGVRSVEVPVTLVDDDVEEVHERFLLELSDPVNAEFGDTVGAGTIFDDDGLIEILLDDPDPVYEGPGATVDFVVRLSRADPVDPVSFSNYMSQGTADFNDFILDVGRWTIDPGDTSLTISVELVDDTEAEGTETFVLGINQASSNATISGIYYEATARILDDDGRPELSVSDAPVADEGATATFTVELSHTSTQEVTVAYAAVVDPLGGDAAAIPGQDFEAVAGTLTIPALATSATVEVPLPDDALNEHVETFWLRLAGPTGAGILDGTGVGTIVDDDPLPVLDIFDASATEGDTIRFAVTLDTVSGRTVTVPWTTAPSHTGDPASPTDDYAAASGTLTFPSGTTTVPIDIDTVDDEVSEADETFQIQLGQPTNATVDDGVAVGAIIDDDGLPRISIAGDELLEIDSPAIFVVTLSSPSGQPVTVDYATAEVTATAGDDYGTPDGEATGTLVIPAGLHTGEISVYVADDGVPEGTETFWITLNNAVNAVIAEGSGIAVGTILDDDKARIAVGDADAYEADGTIEFPVTLSAAGADPVTVRYTTFDGSATQPDDYTAASTTLTIPAHTTAATIAVTLTDDTYTEEPESFLVRLSDPTDAEIATAEAVGVILDDDNLPVLSIEDIFGREDDGALLWSVNLSRPSDREVTVDYTTVAAHSCPPTPAFELVSGTLVFEPGSTTAAFELPLVDNSDSCVPNNWRIEEVRASLSNPMNAQLGVSYSASAHIHDDESRPYASFLFRSWDRVLQVGEGDGTFFFTIQLWRTSEDDITFDYRVDETATLQSYIHSGWRADYLNRPQATAASDFPALDGSVTIPAGERYATVTVPILDDGIVEETETFMIALLDNSDVDYILQALRVEIIDDDARSLAVEGIEVHESAGTAQFRVTLDGGGGQPVTVQYATADGTAIAPDDYAHTVGELTFSDGATSAFVQVPLVDDEVTEASETFELRLSNPVGADIGRGTATATIRDDNLPVITLASASEVSEDQDRNVSHLCFDLTASDAGGAPISVDYQYLAAPWLGERAAEPGADYIDRTADGPVTTTFGGPGGETSTRICASVVNDTIPERDEMFILWLSNPVNAVLGNSLGWATILDSDRPIVSIADVGASEADDAVVFTVQLHEPGLDPARLRYTTLVRTSEGEAAARPGDDYIHTAGTLNIAAGETTATISVPIIGDNIDEELDETFLLELSEPEGLAFSKSAAVGTIVDDDPGWVIDDRSVWEDAGTVVFTVTRDHTGTSAVTVTYTVTGASAAGGASCTAGVDYITPSGTPSGSVTLQPSDTQANITLTLCNDEEAEGSESLLIELAGVPGRKLTGTGTIVDND